jgi:hypothetical protein
MVKLSPQPHLLVSIPFVTDISSLIPFTSQSTTALASISWLCISTANIFWYNISAVDIHSHEILANAVVDWEVKGINEEISVTNGMETSRCGCGESFTT